MPRLKDAAVAIDQGTPLNRTVKALGVVSLLNDFSSEVTVRTLPLFLSNILGVRIGIIGLIEGIAESTATLLQLISGHLSDRIGRRKALTLFGYGLSNFTKPLLYFATAGWGVVLAIRFLDRVGKGIRSAPRDALITDVTPPEQRGKAFGFRKAMDKTGAVIGLLIGAIVLYLSQRDSVTLTLETYLWLVLLAVLPGLAAVLVLAGWVEERSKTVKATRPTFRWSEVDGRFWSFIGVLVLFTLGNSSDAFLMLRAQTLGLSTVEIFLAVAVLNLVISLSSTKGGALSDVLGRRGCCGMVHLRHHLPWFCLRFSVVACMDSLCRVRPLLRRFSGSGQRFGCRFCSPAPTRNRLRHFQRRSGSGRVSREPHRRISLGLVRPGRAVFFRRRTLNTRSDRVLDAAGQQKVSSRRRQAKL
jgi:MFS family permease